MTTAVILFNLGGPDGSRAVRPFLFNLFCDRAIIRLPAWLRLPLALFIAARRAPLAQEIYERLGGGSPILPNTEAQAAALEAALAQYGQYKVFVCMRYWKPRAYSVARAVKAQKPQHVVLLPLYPQFSNTTTASSLIDWHRAARRARLRAPSSTIFSYPAESGLVEAHVSALRAALDSARPHGKPRVLFSAHGLPEALVPGDPYPKQVERTVAAILRALGADVDYLICYQSRVGPLKWLGPATDAEILRAAQEKRPIIVVPVAFVSEHSETLVELDIDYAALARRHGAPLYLRTAAPGTHPAFIEGLAKLTLRAIMPP